MSDFAARVLRALVIGAVLLLLIWVAVYSTIFREIGAFVTAQANYAGIAPELAKLTGWLIAIAATGTLVRIGFDLVLGRISGIRLLLIAFTGLGLVLSIQLTRREWLFDEAGKGLYYVCPPIGAGDMPRLLSRSIDPLTGTTCPLIDKTSAQVLLLIRRGQIPSVVSIKSTSDVDSLKLYAVSGAPLLYEGAPLPDGTPQIYQGAGYDPRAARLLTTLTESRLAEIRAVFAAREQKANAERAERDADGQRAAVEATRRAAASVERDDRQQRQGASAALQRAMRAFAAYEEARRNASPTATLSQVSDPPPMLRFTTLSSQPLQLTGTAPWNRYFRDEVTVPPVIYFFLRPPNTSQRWQSRIVADLGLGQTIEPASKFVRPIFFDSLDFASIANGDYSSLAALAYPPGLERVILIMDLLPQTTTKGQLAVRFLTIQFGEAVSVSTATRLVTL